MRIGQNPAKFVKTVAKPERITVAVLNYIPFQSGFYAELLDVLKTHLQSLRADAGLPFDLMVFDNGSCEEVRQYLLEEYNSGNIQYLLLSQKNLGKGGAWNIIFGGAPGEIIAYTDNDVLYSPGWLAESVKILETYPKVGMVTARPFHSLPELYTSTVAWAQSTPEAAMEQGRLISFEQVEEFLLSLGRTEEEIRQDYEGQDDILLTYRGVQAYVGASHWQFTAYKATLQQFLPFDMSRPMGQVISLDRRMNEQGYLRLMTPDPLAANMSNTTRGVKGAAEKASARRPSVKRHLILDFLPIKMVLLKLHNMIFHWYFDRK